MTIRSHRTVPGLVQALAEANTRTLRAVFAAEGLDGLRPAHVLVLVRLLGGGRRAVDLAADIGVSPQAVAQVAVTLERAGYVSRVSDPGDARAKLLCLTDRGRHALRVTRAAGEQVEQRWRQALGADDLARLRHLLTAVLDIESGE
ncbi:MarR family winged helix-turn-helix transcriptional regulator [Nocardia amikacinitolerans]|uniref:MarR family winged helix-turn-helix transcriptional regulator n=1 Tax=Nocardia amikacinitolerans TaxID=756689 RepID=UPI0020A2C733|nr:MarR family transcriptional regulator [Nocardia amikacinitolerans]MCP2288873.1 transcriptional regulator, MarR family [Nocardia amikacinitolerans]